MVCCDRVRSEWPYPVWSQFCEKKMLDPVHVVLRASMLNQTHGTSNMSRDTSLCRAFHTLLRLENVL